MKDILNDQDFKPYVKYLIGFGLLACLTPILLTLPSFSGIVFKDTGEIGDTIGGTMGPMVGLLGVFFTFLAFFIQYKANQDLRESTEEQRKDVQVERFEAKFYEMLRLHRANVDEMEIDGRYRGRRVFLMIYAEYRFIYQLFEKIIESKGAKVTESWMAKVAYHHCFWGVFSNTEPLADNPNGGLYEDEIELIKKLNQLRKNFRGHKTNYSKPEFRIEDYPFKTNEGVKNELEVDFIPFGGHSSRLGHYYRHLYQTVKMATTDKALNKENSNEEFKTRYSYVKLLRVQLSNHEQAMIYFNSFFLAGGVWWEDSDEQNPWEMELSYFLDYAFIKNLPFNLTRGLGPKPVALFREKLEGRSYPADHMEIEKFSTIDKKLGWLFEWEGG